VSEGETGGSPLALPADMLIGKVVVPKDREPFPWLALLAAATLHLLVLLSFIVDWSHPVPLTEPKVVPVRIVFARPHPPPPPPPAATAPAPKPAPLSYRESGPDQRTTAPPPAETTAKEAAAPPPPAPEQPAPDKNAPPPPPEKPVPAPDKPPAPEKVKPIPHKEVARLEPQKKEAPTPRAAILSPRRRLNVEPGERFETGDPYLNELHARIERHRVYPHIIGQFGLPVEGTAVYDIAIDRSGRVLGMRLARSSGVAGIDQAVAGMIRDSLPFPPLPSNYPDRVGIEVSIRLFPPP